MEVIPTSIFISFSSSKSAQDPFLYYFFTFLDLTKHIVFSSDLPQLHLFMLGTLNLSMEVSQITLFKRTFPPKTALPSSSTARFS